MPRELPEWIGKTDNERPPPRVRLRVLIDRFERRCASCGRAIRSGDRWTCDHRRALINGGENRESNLQPLCDWCNPIKTAADIAAKSMTYRKRRADAGIRKPRTITGWRRFSGEIVRSPRERT